MPYVLSYKYFFNQGKIKEFLYRIFTSFLTSGKAQDVVTVVMG